MVSRIASPAPLAWALALACLLMLALAGIACTPRTSDFIQDATYEPSAGGKKNEPNAGNTVLPTPDVLNR